MRSLLSDFGLFFLPLNDASSLQSTCSSFWCSCCAGCRGIHNNGIALESPNRTPVSCVLLDMARKSGVVVFSRMHFLPTIYKRGYDVRPDQRNPPGRDCHTGLFCPPMAFKNTWFESRPLRVNLYKPGVPGGQRSVHSTRFVLKCSHAHLAFTSLSAPSLCEADADSTWTTSPFGRMLSSVFLVRVKIVPEFSGKKRTPRKCEAVLRHHIRQTLGNQP